MYRILVIAIAICAPANAFADLIGNRNQLESMLLPGYSIDDFETYSVATAENVGTGTIDASSILNGQGPNLVSDNVIYRSATTFQWNGDGYFGLDSNTLVSGSSQIVFLYQNDTDAFGLDFQAFNGFGYSARIEVFDLDVNLISDTVVTVTDAGPTFYGFVSSDGIFGVRISDLTNGFSPVIDNHQYGAIPEPAYGAAILMGAIICCRRRRTHSIQ